MNFEDLMKNVDNFVNSLVEKRHRKSTHKAPLSKCSVYRNRSYLIECLFCGYTFCRNCGIATAKELYNACVTCPAPRCGAEYTDDPEVLNVINRLGRGSK